MFRLTLSLAAAAAVCAASGAATAAPTAPVTHAHAKSATLKGHQYAAQAHFTLAAARAIALKVRPGKIIDQELEKEGGGSGLRYSFDIRSAGKTIEVGVDAKTGKVLENGAESAGAEAAEKTSEAHGK